MIGHSVVLLSSMCFKMVSVDPLEVHPRNACWICTGDTHNSCLSEQMPLSLNIFICIHVSISKGMEVNPPPQGVEMSQCYCCSYSRSRAETSTTPHRLFTPLETQPCQCFSLMYLFFWAAVSQSFFAILKTAEGTIKNVEKRSISVTFIAKMQSGSERKCSFSDTWRE